MPIFSHKVELIPGPACQVVCIGVMWCVHDTCVVFWHSTHLPNPCCYCLVNSVNIQNVLYHNIWTIFLTFLINSILVTVLIKRSSSVKITKYSWWKCYYCIRSYTQQGGLTLSDINFVLGECVRSPSALFSPAAITEERRDVWPQSCIILYLYPREPLRQPSGPIQSILCLIQVMKLDMSVPRGLTYVLVKNP